MKKITGEVNNPARNLPVNASGLSVFINVHLLFYATGVLFQPGV